MTFLSTYTGLRFVFNEFFFLVSRFVVDDGGAFLSEDEDWEPPDSSLDWPGEWGGGGGRGTRSRPVA